MFARLMLGLGAACIVVGLGLYSVPLAFIGAGATFVVVALFSDDGKGPVGDETA